MKEYSEAFKRKLVQRMLMPNGPSANKLSQEVGINQPTLSRWLREATTLEAVTKRRKRPTTKNRPTAQKRPERIVALSRKGRAAGTRDADEAAPMGDQRA